MQAYYSLYIDATDELRHMESYITAEHKRGRRMLEVLFDWLRPVRDGLDSVRLHSS